MTWSAVWEMLRHTHGNRTMIRGGGLIFMFGDIIHFVFDDEDFNHWCFEAKQLEMLESGSITLDNFLDFFFTLHFFKIKWQLAKLLFCKEAPFYTIILFLLHHVLFFLVVWSLHHLGSSLCSSLLPWLEYCAAQFWRHCYHTKEQNSLCIYAEGSDQKYVCDEKNVRTDASVWCPWGLLYEHKPRLKKPGRPLVTWCWAQKPVRQDKC